MFLDESAIAILFRLINFSVFLFLILYLFKKYVVNTIKKQIADKEQAMIDLRNQADTLVEDIRVIDQTIKQDVQMCYELKARVMKWRSQAEYSAQENIIKQQEQMKVLKDHVHIQTMYLQRRNAYESILPRVIDQTRKKLEYKFEDEALAREFITQLITSMQKGR